MKFLRRWFVRARVELILRRLLLDSRPRHRFISIAPDSNVRMCIRCDRFEREVTSSWCKEPV